MTAQGVMLTALLAGTVVLVYAACARIVRGLVSPLFAVLPLILAISWRSPYRSLGDALTLFLSVALLHLWLYAQGQDPKRLRNALLAAVAAVVIRPEMLLLPVSAVLIEGWRRRKTLPARQTITAAAVLVAAAAGSAVALGPVGALSAVSGLVSKLRAGTAWKEQYWTFAGAGPRKAYILASTYGIYFHLPMAAPFLALLMRYRRQWWFAPVAAWGALIVFLTLALVQEPYLQGCRAMQAAVVVFTGAPAILSIKGQFPRLFARGPQGRGKPALDNQSPSARWASMKAS